MGSGSVIATFRIRAVGIAPGGGMCRVTGKEIRDTLVLERVIGGQAFDPREATNLDGETAHCAREPQSVARSVKATGCMTCIALMGLEFTCYDPRTATTT